MLLITLGANVVAVALKLALPRAAEIWHEAWIEARVYTTEAIREHALAIGIPGDRMIDGMDMRDFLLGDAEESGRDIILIVGGLFLIAKSTHEIHGSLEGEEGHAAKKVHSSFTSVIIQITLLDIVFSLDSVITAVGMVSTQFGENGIYIMVGAVVISIIAMMLFAGTIGAFVQRHPTIKMLALAFLLLIGVTLIAEGLHQHIPKGYIYFAMAFSVLVEFLNMRLRKGKPVELHNPYEGGEVEAAQS